MNKYKNVLMLYFPQMEITQTPDFENSQVTPPENGVNQDSYTPFLVKITLGKGIYNVDLFQKQQLDETAQPDSDESEDFISKKCKCHFLVNPLSAIYRG